MNLTELMVTLGVTAILALGAGGTLMRSVNQAKTFQDDYEAKMIAAQAARSLTGYSAANNSTVANCSNRVAITGVADYATFFNAAKATDGTGYPLTLLNTAETDSVNLSTGANTGGGPGKSNYQITSLIFTNAVNLPDVPPAGTASIVGDIYINTSNLSSASDIPKFHPTFVARAVLNVNTAVAGGVLTINTCNAVTVSTTAAGQAKNDSSVCSSTIGDPGNAAFGECRKPISCDSTQPGGCPVGNAPAPIALCPLGQYGVTKGVGAPTFCQPIYTACGSGKLAQGIINGQLSCSNTSVNLFGNSITSGSISQLLSGEPPPQIYLPQGVPGVPLATPIPATLPPSAYNDPACAIKWREYNACVIAYSIAVSNGNAPGALSAICVVPDIICSRAYVNSNTDGNGIATNPVTITPLPVNPVAQNCQCGAGTIPDQAYCGYCTSNVDYGLGVGLGTFAQAQQCLNGALVDLTSINTILIPSDYAIVCNGLSRQLVFVQSGVLQIPP